MTIFIPGNKLLLSEDARLGQRYNKTKKKSCLDVRKEENGEKRWGGGGGGEEGEGGRRGC